MKNNTIKKGMFAFVALLGISLSAQAQEVTNDVTKQDVVALKGAPSLSGSVRVIDNKGTIKYLQVQNGLTQITNSNTGGNIVTTWQLGGKLTNDTYIDAKGLVFALDGLKIVPNTMTAGTAANIGEESVHGGTSTVNDPYAFLVRNEVTGETMKLLPSQLVISGGATPTVTTPGDDVPFSDPAFLPSSVTKVWVYRNGAKLLADKDYILDLSGAAPALTIKGTGGADPEDYTLMTSDKIEVQWVN